MYDTTYNIYDIITLLAIIKLYRKCFMVAVQDNFYMLHLKQLSIRLAVASFSNYKDMLDGALQAIELSNMKSVIQYMRVFLGGGGQMGLAPARI